jgi:hypothetical protein
MSNFNSIKSFVGYEMELSKLMCASKVNVLDSSFAICERKQRIRVIFFSTTICGFKLFSVTHHLIRLTHLDDSKNSTLDKGSSG